MNTPQTPTMTLTRTHTLTYIKHADLTHKFPLSFILVGGCVDVCGVISVVGGTEAGLEI